MQISVRHTTRYEYSASATYSVQSVRLTPQSFDGQAILSWRIEAPGIERAAELYDNCGNLVHLITHTGEHAELVVSASGIIETAERNGVVRGLREPSSEAVYLRYTAATRPDAAIGALAAAVSGRDPIERLHKLMEAIRDVVDYEGGSTHGGTSASEAFAAGRGVCQDHAQIFIAALRSLGVPARYVTGYLVDCSAEPLPAHHAWAEAWVQDLGWVGFDVANRVCPNESYVRLAAGLDADQAAPIRGSRRGGGGERLDVEVAVQQQMVQQ
jgi:transglutaminase-like putative cysteine protease